MSLERERTLRVVMTSNGLRPRFTIAQKVVQVVKRRIDEVAENAIEPCLEGLVSVDHVPVKELGGLTCRHGVNVVCEEARLQSRAGNKRQYK